MQDRAAAVTRTIRIMRIAFVIFGILLIFVMIRVPSQPRANPTPIFEQLITAMAILCVVIGFIAPRFLRRMAANDQNQSKRDPLQKGFTASILSLAFFNAAMLFGFVLHSLGAEILFVRIAFAAGMISLLIWRPPVLTNSEAQPGIQTE